ncbi:hypothetical protein EVA_15619, partial [gut metagenome]
MMAEIFHHANLCGRAALLQKGIEYVEVSLSIVFLFYDIVVQGNVA